MAVEKDQGTGKNVTLKEWCDTLRTQILREAQSVLMLKDTSVFKGEQAYSGQHSEMQANIMLAYRHLEDARMRIGKILQAAGDGISILDK